MRTIYVIYNRREISKYRYKHKINIALEKASHKHIGFSRENLLKQFFCFYFFRVVEMTFIQQFLSIQLRNFNCK